jgi:hypothetical protein
LQVAELNTGFSRASRSPALRRLAELPPRASAREQHSADRSRVCELKQRALFLNRANAACGSEPGDSRSDDPPCRETAARAILRIAKNNLRKKRLQTTQAYELQNRKKTAIKQPQTNNDFLLTLLRHYAASGLLNLHAPRWYKP